MKLKRGTIVQPWSDATSGRLKAFIHWPNKRESSISWLCFPLPEMITQHFLLDGHKLSTNYVHNSVHNFWPLSWRSIGFIGGFCVPLTQTESLRECRTRRWHTISWHSVDRPVTPPPYCHRGYMSQFPPSHLSQGFLPLLIHSLSPQIQDVTGGTLVRSQETVWAWFGFYQTESWSLFCPFCLLSIPYNVS